MNSQTVRLSCFLLAGVIIIICSVKFCDGNAIINELISNGNLEEPIHGE